MSDANASQRGFSLIELLIVVALLAIVAAMAMPSLQGFVASNRLTAESNELLAGINLARSEAVRTQRRVILCRVASSAGRVTLTASSGCVTTADGAAWQGWAVFVDSDSDGSFDTGEPMLRSQAITAASLVFASDAVLGAAGNRIVFRPDGLARAVDAVALQAAQITVCDSSGALAANNGRNVVLLSGSRVAVTRATINNCGVVAPLETPSEEGNP